MSGSRLSAIGYRVEADIATITLNRPERLNALTVRALAEPNTAATLDKQGIVARKTTAVATWLRARRLPALWYHLDAGDHEVRRLGGPSNHFARRRNKRSL